MSAIQIRLMVFAVGVIAIWFIFAFVTLEPNPLKWSETNRFFSGFLWLFAPAWVASFPSVEGTKP